MRVRLLRAAPADIRLETAHYKKPSPRLSERFRAAVQQATQAIAFQPLAMQIVDMNIRRWPVDSGFPHGIMYCIDADDILVIAAFHPKQTPAKWIGRSPP